MAIIYDRTKPGETDKILSIAGEQIARTLTDGTNWNWLRVAVRYEISRSTAADISSPKFAIGLTTGTSSLYGDLSTTHFVGVASNIANSMIYNTNFTPPVYNNGTLRYIVKSGSTERVASSNLTWEVPTISSTSSMARVCQFVDFIKSPADPGFWLITTNTSHMANLTPSDTSFTTFFNQLSALTASLGANDRTSSYVAVSESINGYLNSVNIYWNQSTPPVEISDVYVFRFA